eukprot:3131295-Amphidinium_carterae.1
MEVFPFRKGIKELWHLLDEQVAFQEDEKCKQREARRGKATNMSWATIPQGKRHNMKCKSLETVATRKFQPIATSQFVRS